MAKANCSFHRRCSSEMLQLSDRKNSTCFEEFHVLAVDDSFVDRKVIERLLKISSCKVTVVESGKRALQFLGLDGEKSSSESNGLKLHLIITDYSMPEITGYDLLKRVKESSAFREVPVVIMSSEKILARMDRCLEEGAEEYLVKPVTLSDVKRLLEFIMRGHSNVAQQNERSPSKLIPSATSPKDIHPLLLGYSYSSSGCISRSPQFRSRSSKYHSELSQH